jgi:hypothetical protein
MCDTPLVPDDRGMHPQLSPVVAHMRLDELSNRHQPRTTIVRTTRAPRSFGRRRSASRAPTPGVAPVVALADTRAGRDVASDRRVA